jgi:formate hydrogenlyase transcriptional activator
MDQVAVVAPTDATVMVLGETGVGKELIATAIHENSRRAKGPFVKVNCAAIPSGLLESELFGHERGAFTGALVQRSGRFELAHRGTLFLDEVGDIPLDLQPKLLRVLQEQEFERLGSGRTIRTDVRLVAATHRDLWRMVEAGQFRADLYYRLSVFPLRVPPLRERREDIPALVEAFVQRAAERVGREIDTIPDDVVRLFQEHDWPGNIRELQNVVERAVILSSGRVFRPAIDDLRRFTRPRAADSVRRLSEVERDHIIEVLRQAGGVIGGHQGAAALLGMARTTLLYRMKKLGINSGQPQTFAAVYRSRFEESSHDF